MMINPLCDSTQIVYITMLVKGDFFDDRNHHSCSPFTQLLNP
jgi:hypothetical protein